MPDLQQGLQRHFFVPESGQKDTAESPANVFSAGLALTKPDEETVNVATARE
jgi:hypothetical protein